jgi:hypothetical protein
LELEVLELKKKVVPMGLSLRVLLTRADLLQSDPSQKYHNIDFFKV